MNETELLNQTFNATANETVRDSMQQGGGWSFDLVKSVDLLLNNDLSNGVAAIINHTFGVQFFSGSLLIGLIVILTVWWKWSAVVQFIGQIGTYILLSAAGFLILKAMGVL